MPNTIPLVLATGTRSLFAADVNGQPILSHPIWMGARAEGLDLGDEIAELEATPSGAIYDEFAQLSELHEISIERIWVMPFGPEAGPGARRMVDYDLTRGQYVMQVFWIDQKTGLWHQRTYYGVQAKRYGLKSNGVIHFGSNQLFRAQYFTTTHGTSDASGVLTPPDPCWTALAQIPFDAAISQSGSPLRRGLAGYWRLEEATGTRYDRF